MSKIIVVGAGISGLATSWWLHKKFPDKSIVILDKADRTGGLVYTDHQHGFPIDLGPKGFIPFGEGQYTLKLIHELNLQEALTFSDKTAKQRFAYFKGKAHKLSPWALIREGLPLAIMKDLFASRYHQDSSVYDFLSRHSNQRLIRHLLNPAVIAMKAGRSEYLSTYMAFPDLAKREAKSGSILLSLLKDMLKKQKKASPPVLASLQPNLGLLIDTLTHQLPVTWKLSSPVSRIQCFPSHVEVTTDKETISGELVIYTGPLSSLSDLIPSPEIKRLAMKSIDWSLSCISLSWDKSLPIPKGYGMLVADEPPLLGIVFNSRVFPNQLPGKTVVSFLLEHHWHNDEAYAFALAAASEYLGITDEPDTFSLFSPENGLPQHGVGFLEMRNRILPTLPHNLKIVGQNFAGPGLNKCTAAAYQTVASI